MNSKFTLVLILLSFLGSAKGQMYNDTLSYKSGMVRLADFQEKQNKVIKYYYLNSKGERKYTTINTGKLKYFVICDSLNNVEFDSRLEK